MATVDRFVRQARRHLADGEGLLATVVGRETNGRRRVAVVATDRRLLVVTLRPEPPVEFDYAPLEVTCDTVDGAAVLTLATPASTTEIARINDVRGAQLLVDLVRRRLDGGRRQDRLPRVSIVS